MSYIKYRRVVEPNIDILVHTNLLDPKNPFGLGLRFLAISKLANKPEICHIQNIGGS